MNVPQPPLVRLEAVDRDYTVGGETVHGLAGVDLEIGAGEYLAVTGPSGSGKSTLLHTIGLLDRPDRGNLYLEGVDTATLDDEGRARLRRERIGFVFQFFHLVPRLTALENVELPLMLAGVPLRQRRQRAREVLASLGLADRADHRPDQLSGGQRQRVAIGRAVVTRPALLLADEPTGNLDRASGGQVMTILEEEWRRGVTLVVVTHDPELAARAHRQVRMADGRIIGDTVRPGGKP